MGMSVQEAGRKGGKARAAKLSKEQRVAIAKQGYKASPLSRKQVDSQVTQTGENKK